MMKTTMKGIGLAIGFLSAVSVRAFAADQVLEGTYKLVSSTRKVLETGEIVDTYGKQPPR